MLRGLRVLRRYRTAALLACVGLSWALLRYALAPTLAGTAELVANAICDLLCIVTVVCWGLVRARNVVSAPTRRLLAAVVALILLWMVLRTAKFRIVSDPNLARWLWYAYYVPICLLPPVSTLCAASVGEDEGWRPGRSLPLLLVAGATLAAGVLTNDLHQQMFRFFGPGPWDAASYSYGPLRPVLLTFVGACVAATIVLLVGKSHVPLIRSWMLAPLVPPALGVAYTAAYPLLSRSDMTTFYCLLTIFEFEALIACGLVPVNDGYHDLFSEGDLRAAVLDEGGAVRVSSGSAPASWNDAGSLPVGLVTRSVPVTGGSFVWVEDSTLEWQLHEQLEERRRELSDEVDLAQAHADLERRRAETDVRAHLHERVESELRGTFARAARLVDEGEHDPDRRAELLAELCVVGGFAKRYCNLILMEDRPQVSTQELFWCLRESCDHLREAGRAATVSSSGEARTPPVVLEAAYALFEEVIEQAYPTLTALLAHLQVEGGVLRLALQLDCGGNGVDAHRPLAPAAEKVERLGGRVAIERGMPSRSVSAWLPLDGTPGGDE